jgi:antitoxin HigA-1
VLKTIRDPELAPPHPGEILREDMLPRLRLGPVSLARKLGLPINAVKELLAERCPVTAEIAANLARVFGHPIRFWLGLQAQHDLWFGGSAPQSV